MELTQSPRTPHSHLQRNCSYCREQERAPVKCVGAHRGWKALALSSPSSRPPSLKKGDSKMTSMNAMALRNDSLLICHPATLSVCHSVSQSLSDVCLSFHSFYSIVYTTQCCTHLHDTVVLFQSFTNTVTESEFTTAKVGGVI